MWYKESLKALKIEIERGRVEKNEFLSFDQIVFEAGMVETIIAAR